MLDAAPDGERRRQLRTLAGATVSISSGFFSRRHADSFTNQNGITGSYNTATGVLTLTGTDDGRATTRRRCDSITFSSPSDDPTSFGTDTSRTITWTVNDGALKSARPPPAR